jgi:hypothetical protein
MSRKIIGICGFIGSGKGTAGDILVDDYGFTKLSFADKLKDGVSAVFGWDRELLEGITKDSREWREAPDEFWTKELGREITPRFVIQSFGTDCVRKGFDENVWTLFVKQKLQENPTTDYVIPDVRFYNERDMIRKESGKIWRVKKGKEPSWLNEAISDNRYDTTWMTNFPDIHESEWRWIDYPNEFDRTIINDSDLENLKNEVRRAIG